MTATVSGHFYCQLIWPVQYQGIIIIHALDIAVRAFLGLEFKADNTLCRDARPVCRILVGYFPGGSLGEPWHVDTPVFGLFFYLQ